MTHPKHGRVARAFGAAALLLAGLCSPPAGTGVARADDAFAPATRLLMAGDARGALAVYEAYLTATPQGEFAPLAALAAGNLRREALGDPEGAVADYDRILALHRASPWASEAARRKGECLERGERWEAAGSTYGEALELAGSRAAGGGTGGSPQVSAAWINEVALAAANCYYRLGDRQRVVATYERVLAGTLPPDARAATLYRLGECHETAGETDRAARRYREVLEGHPLAPEFARALGKRELIEPHEPLDWSAYEAYAAALGALRQRDFPASLAQCEAVLAGQGSAALAQHAEYCRISAETILAGEYTAGARKLENLRRRMPRDAVPPQIEQTLTRYRQTAELEAAASRAPQDAEVLARLGQAYLQAGSVQPAAQTLERALAVDGDHDQARFVLGQAYTQLGDGQRAAEAYELYLARNPDDVNALNLIGYAWIGSDPERAIGYFQRYAALAPDDANAHDSLGEGYLTAGRLEEAAAEYERAVTIDATFANSYFMLGQVRQQLDHRDQAVAAYRQFLELTGGADPRTSQAEAALRDLGAEPR